MRYLTFFLLFLLPLVVAKRAFADETTGYEVEVIIFAYANNPYMDSENWQEVTHEIQPEESQPPQDETQTATENMEAGLIPQEQPTETGSDNILPAENSDMEGTQILDETSLEEEPTPVDLSQTEEELPPEKYILQKEAQKIQASRKYILLAHKAWKQAGLGADKAFPVHISSIQAPADETTDTPEADTSIDGEITLVMSRYLHVNIDLSFYQTIAPDNNMSDMGTESVDRKIYKKEYKISLQRRMRSKELHYIDHPLIGVLVQATPFVIESKQPENSPGNTYKTLSALP